MKMCSKCNLEKEESFFSYTSRGKLETQCKLCIAHYKKQWLSLNKNKDKQNKYNYNSINKSKILNDQKQWRSLNSDYIKHSNRKRYIQMSHEERLREKDRYLEYKRNNPDKVKLTQKKWASKNPIKIAANKAKRRAAKLNALPEWLSIKEIKRINAYYRLSRYMSNKTGQKYEVDHIVPLQGKNVSGFHVPWNLQILIQEKNRSKGNTYLDTKV